MNTSRMSDLQLPRALEEHENDMQQLSTPHAALVDVHIDVVFLFLLEIAKVQDRKGEDGVLPEALTRELRLQRRDQELENDMRDLSTSMRNPSTSASMSFSSSSRKRSSGLLSGSNFPQLR